jgi:hypothetical protein
MVPAFSQRNTGSIRSPTETKKIMANTSLKGSISARAWWL